MMTKAKEDGEGRSLMRRRADDIADEIIKALIESRDEGGHGPVSPLTMTVSVGSEYDTHRSVVLVEHLVVVLRARLRRNDSTADSTMIRVGAVLIKILETIFFQN